MRFILSRNEDYLSHSKKWILGYAFLFWFITRIAVIVIMAVGMAIYTNYGLNPQELTKFGGDPTVTGFPSSIKISSKGETVDIKGSNNLPRAIAHIQVLDYDGNGNDSSPLTEEKDYIETTTDWLTVKYIFAENKLVLNATPNGTKKNRKLYPYLLDGKSRQEITVTQSK